MIPIKISTILIALWMCLPSGVVSSERVQMVDTYFVSTTMKAHVVLSGNEGFEIDCRGYDSLDNEVSSGKTFLKDGAADIGLDDPGKQIEVVSCAYIRI